jgi:hypothetical protein
MFSATAKHAKQMLIENAATKYFSFSGDISGSQKSPAAPRLTLLAANFAFVQHAIIGTVMARPA